MSLGPENTIGRRGHIGGELHSVDIGDYWHMHKTHGIIRVFPRRTSMTPRDPFAFVGEPPLPQFRPPTSYPVHVSVTFTWDIEKGYHLRDAWHSVGYKYPKLGGPAFNDSPINGHYQSKYLKDNVFITSTGCNCNCPWCLVPMREGKLKEKKGAFVGAVDANDDIYIQDNNLLQCSQEHIDEVFRCLRFYKRIQFTGGLDSRLVNDRIVEGLRSLRIKQLFLACDTKEAIRPLRKAIDKLAGFKGRIRCYVLLGFGNESISEATARLEDVWRAGAMPFAQLYQPPDQYIDYPKEWQLLARIWSRPAAMRAFMRANEVDSDIEL